MSCFYPLWRNVNFRELVKVPCGVCRGCRLDRARDWSLRCVHEAQMNECNSFITLTYNDTFIPVTGSVSKRELQLFIKRLRKKLEPETIRYYACGEYGDKLIRPHYHALIFGFDFPDKEFHHVSDPKKRNRFSTGSSYKVYTSYMLDRIWKKGFSTIGEVTLESAGYVARYVGKKIGGELAREHCDGLEPEFALMSRRPGIGSTWLDKYFSDVYPKDFTTVDGRKFKAPRFYDAKLMKKSWGMYEEVKLRREDNITEDDCIRRRQKEKYLKNVTSTLERSFEND